MELESILLPGVEAKRPIVIAGPCSAETEEQGEGLSEHSAPFDALVQVLEGSANIVVNGQVFTVNAGESIVFPANAPHALVAVEKFKMLLTMIKE